MRPALRWHWRFLAALIAFGVTVAVVEDRVGMWMSARVLEAGEAAGCRCFRDGRVRMTANGPFVGDSFRDAAFNAAYRHAPYMSGYGIAFVVALIVYHVLTGRRMRPDGHTRCGACGYILKGLLEPRCPECGTRM